jgi:hypothetical protein
MSYPSELNIRVHFKLNAARRHLDNLVQLEQREGSLAQAVVRIEAETDIDECLYHLIGVKDALLQEINTELRLGLDQRDVTLAAINAALNQRGTKAKAITKEIDDMISVKHDPRWLINELHNHSKHRNLIGQALNMQDGVLQRSSLIDPRTGQGMKTEDGRRILTIAYLEDSYTRIEDLQKTVREKIQQYHNSIRTLATALLHLAQK